MTSPAGLVVAETERLRIVRLVPADAPFVLELVNEPGWLRWIGDRNVHTLDDARAYIEGRILSGYAANGFGFYKLERQEDGEAVGLCGLARRAGLDDADLGFALLERHAGHGYALEAARRVVRHAHKDAGLARLVAITLAGNTRSIALLEKLGMRRERAVQLPGGTEELQLYAMALPPGD